jgi:hypothetical protein
MSALDLFASAMGAFILIMLVLLPYYLKSSTDSSPVCPVLPNPNVCPVCAEPEPVPACPTPTTVIKLKDNLLVIQMEWNNKIDVDLYVTTPDGEYSYRNKTIAGRPGKMTLDNINGSEGRGQSSLEIWMSYAPTPGRYVVCFKNLGGYSVAVKGRLDKPSGPVAIRTQSINGNGKACPLKFEITPDYVYQAL